MINWAWNFAKWVSDTHAIWYYSSNQFLKSPRLWKYYTELQLNTYWVVSGASWLAWVLSYPSRATRKWRLRKLGQNWDGNPYYPCSCTHCGWVGSSRILDGGNQTWDGDYEEIFCPRCGANEEKICDH